MSSNVEQLATRAPNREEISNRKSALSVIVFGVISYFAFYLNIYTLQHHNQSAAAVGMSSMHMNNMAKFWAIPVIQASGMAAILASYLTIILGLQQSRRAGFTGNDALAKLSGVKPSSWLTGVFQRGLYE